jgi:hypothetical protein
MNDINAVVERTTRTCRLRLSGGAAEFIALLMKTQPPTFAKREIQSSFGFVPPHIRIFGGNTRSSPERGSTLGMRGAADIGWAGNGLED